MIIQYHIRDGIPPDINVREGFYTLHYSQHAKGRFIERAGNDPIFPKIVNVIKGRNVATVKVDESNPKVASELVVRLQYRKYIRLFLVIVPYDNGTALVKTLWFKEKTKRNERKLNKISIINYDKRPVNSEECFQSGTQEDI